MKHPYLIPRKSGNKTYFHFRSKIPIDLIPTFSGRKEFHISLKNVSNKETLLVSVSLQTLTEQLFNDIRRGYENTHSGRCKRNSESGSPKVYSPQSSCSS